MIGDWFRMADDADCLVEDRGGSILHQERPNNPHSFAFAPPRLSLACLLAAVFRFLRKNNTVGKINILLWGSKKMLPFTKWRVVTSFENSSLLLFVPPFKFNGGLISSVPPQLQIRHTCRIIKILHPPFFLNAHAQTTTDDEDEDEV